MAQNKNHTSHWNFPHKFVVFSDSGEYISCGTEEEVTRAIELLKKKNNREMIISTYSLQRYDKVELTSTCTYIKM